MKMKKNLVIIILGLLIIGAIFSFISLNKNSQSTGGNIENLKVLKFETDIDTTNWEVYKNSKYKYSFKYPKEIKNFNYKSCRKDTSAKDYGDFIGGLDDLPNNIISNEQGNDILLEFGCEKGFFRILFTENKGIDFQTQINRTTKKNLSDINFDQIETNDKNIYAYVWNNKDSDRKWTTYLINQKDAFVEITFDNDDTALGIASTLQFEDQLISAIRVKLIDKVHKTEYYTNAKSALEKEGLSVDKMIVEDIEIYKEEANWMYGRYSYGLNPSVPLTGIKNGEISNIGATYPFLIELNDKNEIIDTYISIDKTWGSAVKKVPENLIPQKDKENF